MRILWTGLLLLGTAMAQISSETTGGIPAPDPPSDQTQTTAPQDTKHGFWRLVKRGAQDQENIYTAPFRLRNLKWDTLFLLSTAGLIATDKQISGAISHDNASTSQTVSDVGLYSTIAATGVLFISGALKKNNHSEETGILGFEAFLNTLAVNSVTQLMTGRERPLEGTGNGRFWVNDTLGSSFPSNHSGLTWSMATVLAHQYPRPCVQFLAYGTAAAVSVTRVTGLKHFPSDVAVGGIFGYLIGKHIFHAHSTNN